MALAEQTLEVEEDTFKHSFAICPVCLQKRQRFCSKQCCDSCWVSFPIFTKLGGEVRVGLCMVSIATARVSVTGVAEVALSAIVVFILVSILSGVVVCISLSLIIRAFVLVGGWIFSGHLRTALPIMVVNRLGEGAEFGEGVRFAKAGDFVLDLGWKSMIQLLAEGGVAPLDSSSKVVEVDEVLHNVLVVAHAEILKVDLGFAFRAMWSKVVL